MHKVYGRYYKLIHRSKAPDNNKPYSTHCTACDLFANICNRRGGTCMPRKEMKVLKCRSHVYKELDGLYADLIKVKEAGDG